MRMKLSKPYSMILTNIIIQFSLISFKFFSYPSTFPLPLTNTKDDLIKRQQKVNHPSTIT